MEKDFEILNTRNQLTDLEENLLVAAENVLQFSYSPYSSFRVATALLTDDGSIVTGVNQENASYPAGLCAEQVALYRMGIEFPGQKIRLLALTASQAGTQAFHGVSPCGICRQVMIEFVHRQGDTFGLIMPMADGKWLRVKRVEALLPFGFTTKTQ